jgi:TRAP-type C4-dicarboxylate transport system permease small subunit
MQQEDPGPMPVPTEQWYRAVIYLVLLVMGLAVCMFALLRLSRRYRERLLRKPDKPTPTPDIWRMHKLPEDEEGQ